MTIYKHGQPAWQVHPENYRDFQALMCTLKQQEVMGVEAFKELKAELTRPALYSPDAPTKICADAFTYGLGAMLLQQHEWKPPDQ